MTVEQRYTRSKRETIQESSKKKQLRGLRSSQDSTVEVLHSDPSEMHKTFLPQATVCSDSPELALLQAVIFRAVHDVVGVDVTKEERTIALWWINSQSREPWSFRWCADHLDVDTEYFVTQTRKLLKLKVRNRLERDRLWHENKKRSAAS